MDQLNIYLERAELLLNQGRLRDAEKELARVLEQNPEHDMALSLLAQCRYSEKRMDDGLELVNRALAINPQEAHYYYLRAFGLYHKNHNQLAMTELDRALQLSPWVSHYYGLWALILIEERDFESGLEKANEGLAMDSEDITCLNARSTALNKLKRTDEAIATMQDALASDPDNDFTHISVGWNLLEKGKHRDATVHFREALRLNPDSGSAKAGLKEALKSKIPPYRWLLQYSFWISNRGKNARWVVPLVIYFAVRFIGGSSRAMGATTVAAVVGIAYFIFVAATWIITPLSNFFLLFHPDGKYALSVSEKWGARMFMTAVLAGIILITIYGFSSGDSQSLLYSSLIAFSLMVVLGHLEYPIELKKKRGVPEWVGRITAALGILTLITFTFSEPIALSMAIAYAIVFIIYQWSGFLSSS